MKIRHSRMEDLDALEETFAIGRHFLRQIGNYYQWPNGYPSREKIQEDIENGHSYVAVTDENDDTELPVGTIVATFYLHHGRNPVFRYTEADFWQRDGDDYVTIHRICTNRKMKKAGNFCFEWITERYDDVRFYTHETNVPIMALGRHYGFVNCGEFTIGEPEPRLAFQFIRKKESK